MQWKVMHKWQLLPMKLSNEAKHLVIAQLVDWIEIRKNDGCDITIHWRMTAEQFLGRKTEASA